MASTGDRELDNLIRSNLVGLLRTGKIRTRRKAKKRRRANDEQTPSPLTTDEREIDEFGFEF